MKFALVNPGWSFKGSVYFGCREAHLPLEFGYAKALLEAAGAECHIFDGHFMGLPARGCPFHCSFCAREAFRGPYRRPPLSTVLAELDSLIEAGVEYVYFIDETFFPEEALLEALSERPVRFGIQTRIDLWSRPHLQDSIPLPLAELEHTGEIR